MFSHSVLILTGKKDFLIGIYSFVVLCIYVAKYQCCITVDLENFDVKKLRKAHTSTKLKHTRFFTMTILLLNN